MTRIRLTPGADSIKIGGATYLASGNIRGGGYANVDNPSHARAALASSRAEGGSLHALHTGAVGVPGRRCEPCSFNGYAFQKECPRCGGPMEET